MKRLAVLVALLAGACSNRPSQADCEVAADQMIDIFTAPRLGESGKAPPEAMQASEEWKKNLKTKDPTRAALVSACMTKMTGDHVTCIKAALDERSLAACFGG